MAGLAALLVLAGCSEPEAANDTLPTATSTSASPTLEPLGPADFPVPDEAREQTEAGAEAMARYYLDLIDRTKDQVGSAELDANSMRDLSNGCEVCDQIAASFENGQSLGYTYDGTDLADPSISATVLDGSTADITFTVEQSALTVVGADGVEVRSSPAVLLRGGMVFDWDDVRDGWIATQLNLVQDE